MTNQYFSNPRNHLQITNRICQHAKFVDGAKDKERKINTGPRHPGEECAAAVVMPCGCPGCRAAKTQLNAWNSFDISGETKPWQVFMQITRRWIHLTNGGEAAAAEWCGARRDAGPLVSSGVHCAAAHTHTRARGNCWGLSVVVLPGEHMAHLFKFNHMHILFLFGRANAF